MLCVESEELSSSCWCRTLSLSRTFESFLFLRSKFYSLFRENVTIQFSLRSLTSSFCLVFTHFSSCWAFAVPFFFLNSAHLHNASRLSRFEHRSHHVEQRRRRLWQSYGYRWAAGIPHHRRSRLFHADYHLSCKYCLSTKHKLLIPPRVICNLHLDFACMLFFWKGQREHPCAESLSEARRCDSQHQWQEHRAHDIAWGEPMLGERGESWSHFAHLQVSFTHLMMRC